MSISVVNVSIHENWDARTNNFDADIAVLELLYNVDYSMSIQPICLIKPHTQPAIGETGLVVGFGKSENEDLEHEYIARFLEAPIHENLDCFLNNSVLIELSSKRTFCGGYGNGSGVCTGDSGSGFVVSYNNTYYLRGIVSAALLEGKYGCNTDTFSIFTDVPKFYNWIETGSPDIVETDDEMIQGHLIKILKILQKPQNESNLSSRISERLPEFISLMQNILDNIQ